MVDSGLKAALKEILYASLSLDDGLSTIQNLAIMNEQEDTSLYFDIARVIEEIILRRPGLASAKVTELTVRLAFEKDPTLRKMLTLLDARYNTVHEIAECELIPDIEALPRLLDIHGELIQAMLDALDLNLRPLLPFLTDEILATLDGICTRGHKAISDLAIHEAHYLSSILADNGVFDCAEAILNRLMALSKEGNSKELGFEVSLDEASVLTELRMYDESRNILLSLKESSEVIDDPVKYAAVLLQLAVNETRDDKIPYKTARSLADQAAQRFEMILDSEGSPNDGLGLAYLIIGSNILVNGWREAVPEGIERLESALRIFESIENPSPIQLSFYVKCLTGLGFAHGLMRDYESTTKSIGFFERALIALEGLKGTKDYESSVARTHNAMGWVCLASESGEFWQTGIEAFEKAIDLREDLCSHGEVTDLELLSSKVGLALSQLRFSEDRASVLDQMHSILSQYVPIFPTDNRAYTEIAIATYNLIWLSIRHSIELPPKISRLLDDIDKMLVEARSLGGSVFINGVSLIIPYLTSSWSALTKRSNSLKNDRQLGKVAKLIHALAVSKQNIASSGSEMPYEIIDVVDDDITTIDPLLAQYWKGQTALASTIRQYYENKDYSELATGLARSAAAFKQVEEITPIYSESAEFINATALTLSKSLSKFASVLSESFGAVISDTNIDSIDMSLETDQFSFLLAEEWIGLLKISDSYLNMIKDLEFSRAQPYLNAIFSNTARALRMMDSVSLIERRVFSHLGDTMNERYYLRR